MKFKISLLVNFSGFIFYYSCAETNGYETDYSIDRIIDSRDIISDSSDIIIDGETATGCGSGGVCPTGQTCCPDNKCYNLTNDPSNCGECGKSCFPKGNRCIAGNCSCNGASPCTREGYICCETGGCLDPSYDPLNCGGCGIKCNEGQSCIGGRCGGSCEGVGCPEVPHGTAECVDGTCKITSCDPGWSDGDGNFSNGCECQVTIQDRGGDSCNNAYDLGQLHDSEPGASTIVEGFTSPSAPEDWYRFEAIDDPETGLTVNCDNFHVDIRFLSNPGRSYVFDVRQASCTTGPVVCENDTEYVMSIDSRQPDGSGGFWGECPCSTTPQANANLCTDNSSPFFVVVKLAEGANPPGCEPYRLEISNGKYNYSP